jgi:hypothetical protein
MNRLAKGRFCASARVCPMGKKKMEKNSCWEKKDEKKLLTMAGVVRDGRLTW